MVAELTIETRERDRLETRYARVFSERLDWGRHVNYGSNRLEPVHGWFRYKEAFARRLVQEVVQDGWRLPKRALIFDPFAGCGTTLLTSYELGYRGLGCDVMPIAVFVARVKLAYETYDVGDLEQAVAKLLHSRPRVSRQEWPDVQIVELAFTPAVRSEILACRDSIAHYDDPAVRDFLMLGLLASLEEVSSTSKDGQFLRLVERRPRSVKDALERNFSKMLADLRAVRLMHSTNGTHRYPAKIVSGDARKLPTSLRRFNGRAAGIVTSPPYLNRYDYSRSYALELCLMFGDDGEPCVREFTDLKAIRHSLLRSHIESRPAPTNLVDIPALDEVLASLKEKSLNNARIPIMIEGYFEDMNLVVGEMARMLAPGGRVALVVANARFEGELLPVDLMLSELAGSHGLETDEIRVTRYKGNSSQQMGKYGRVAVRESVCFWRKS